MRSSGRRVLDNSLTDRLIYRGSNKTWEFGQELLRLHGQETETRLIAPNLDLFFSFHAYERGHSGGGPLNKDEYIQNFSLTNLNNLYAAYRNHVEKSPNTKFGFYPSPYRSFYNYGLHTDLTCFPWAVCEWRHQRAYGWEAEDFMYCQAANGAAVSLTINAGVGTAGYDEPLLSELRPVIAFTFAGPEARAWIAFISERKDSRYKYVISITFQTGKKYI